MLANIAEHLEAQYAPLKAALSELVRIPSVCNEGVQADCVSRCPFGEAVDQALLKALQLAS
jgi:hypothetical protein